MLSEEWVNMRAKITVLRLFEGLLKEYIINLDFLALLYFSQISHISHQLAVYEYFLLCAYNLYTSIVFTNNLSLACVFFYLSWSKFVRDLFMAAIRATVIPFLFGIITARRPGNWRLFIVIMWAILSWTGVSYTRLLSM